MSLQFVLTFLVSAALTVYIALLNDDQILIKLTQDTNLEIPIFIFLLASILIGVVLHSFLNWFLEIKGMFRRMSIASQKKERAEKALKCQQLHLKAQNALDENDYNQAREIYKRILKIDPNHAEALNFKGNHLREEGQWEEAIENHKKAAFYAPEHLQIQYNLAKDYSAANQHEEELETLRKIRKLDPGSNQPLKKMRDAYLKMENWDQAINLQKSILPGIEDSDEFDKEQNRLSEIMHARAVDAFQKGDLDKAVTEFRNIINTNPNYVPAYVTLGEIYYKNANPKEAYNIWKTGYDYTKSIVCLQSIHNALESEGRTEDIINLYEAAIRLSGESGRADLIILLGIIHYQQGQNNKAIETLGLLKDSPNMMHQILLYMAQQGQSGATQNESSLEISNKVKKSILEKNCTGWNRLEGWAEQAVPMSRSLVKAPPVAPVPVEA